MGDSEVSLQALARDNNNHKGVAMIEKLLHIGVINGSIALVLCVWILAVYGYGLMALKLACKRYAIFGSLLGDSLALASLLALSLGALC